MLRIKEYKEYYSYILNIMTKRTLRGTKLKRARTSGFRARIKTSSGRRVLKARRARGRHSLSIS